MNKETLNKKEILKLIASPLEEITIAKEHRLTEKHNENRVKARLKLELKAFKQYYSITSVSNFFVGSMFEFDFEKLELLFKQENVASIENFKLRVN